MKYGAYSTNTGDDGGLSYGAPGRDQSPTNVGRPRALANMRAQMLKSATGGDHMQLQQHSK